MKSIPSVFLPGCAVALGLLFLSGCDDLDARNSAAEASRQVNELKGKLEDAQKRANLLDDRITEMKTTLTKQVDDRADKIEAQLAANQKALLEQLGQEIKMSREAAAGIADTARADNDKELKAEKQLVAENMQTIRAEMATELEKLRQFMDNQLKEVYPYAYQPRRLDPAAPPGDPAQAPKKADAAAPAPDQK